MFILLWRMSLRLLFWITFYLSTSFEISFVSNLNLSICGKRFFAFSLFCFSYILVLFSFCFVLFCLFIFATFRPCGIPKFSLPFSLYKLYVQMQVPNRKLYDYMVWIGEKKRWSQKLDSFSNARSEWKHCILYGMQWE